MNVWKFDLRNINWLMLGGIQKALNCMFVSDSLPFVINSATAVQSVVQTWNSCYGTCYRKPWWWDHPKHSPVSRKSVMQHLPTPTKTHPHAVISCWVGKMSILSLCLYLHLLPLHQGPSATVESSNTWYRWWLHPGWCRGWTGWSKQHMGKWLWSTPPGNSHICMHKVRKWMKVVILHRNQ